MNLNLKEVLKLDNIKNGIKTNLFVTDKEAEDAIEKTINLDKDNAISIKTLRKEHEIEFFNTLYVDKNKELYLLESRVFEVDGQMINAYLEVFNERGKVVDENIDDVWDYADWQMVKA